MGNCSNISTTQAVSLTAGTLTSGFCHTSLQSTYEEFINRTEAQLSRNVAGFVAGDDTPNEADQDKLWFKQDGSNCYAPLGWHYWNGTDDWLPVKTPVSSLADNTQGDIIYYGASGAPAVLNVGTAGHYLKTKGAGENPEWAAAPQMGFTSAQGTATSTALASTTDFTNTGSITLTLPSGKTWLWVRVVFSTFCHSSGGINDFEVRNGTGLSDTVFSDWVQNDPPTGVLTGNSDDVLTVTWTAEGVPTGHTDDSSLTLYTYSKKYSSTRTDAAGYRVLYAVGQYI